MRSVLKRVTKLLDPKERPRFWLKFWSAILAIIVFDVARRNMTLLNGEQMSVPVFLAALSVSTLFVFTFMSNVVEIVLELERAALRRLWQSERDIAANQCIKAVEDWIKVHPELTDKGKKAALAKLPNPTKH